jgi:hypothetical protein
MIAKIVVLNGLEFQIKVTKLPDNSVEGIISCAGNQLAKMSISATDSHDIKIYRQEDTPDLIARILEDYVKSGFKKASVSSWANMTTQQEIARIKREYAEHWEKLEKIPAIQQAIAENNPVKLGELAAPVNDNYNSPLATAGIPHGT